MRYSSSPGQVENSGLGTVKRQGSEGWKAIQGARYSRWGGTLGTRQVGGCQRDRGKAESESVPMTGKARDTSEYLQPEYTAGLGAGMAPGFLTGQQVVPFPQRST